MLPAYTHLQRAQPVLAAHYWLAYVEKFERDRSRLATCRARTNVLSLGAAAVAGTSLPIDRQFVARELRVRRRGGQQHRRVERSRFLIEFVFCLSLVAIHLSHWAEEWILWSTSEFQFLRLPQAFCTGSSIMPQKVNPDVLELIRGKTARVIGALTTLLTLVKGLPLAYNRDLQEDKQPLFDAFDTVSSCLAIAAPLVARTELNRPAIAERLERGHLDATTLMEYLIRRGMPQRTAHGVVGKLVRLAIDRGCGWPICRWTSFRPPTRAWMPTSTSAGGRKRDQGFRQLRLDRAGGSGRADSHLEAKLECREDQDRLMPAPLGRRFDAVIRRWKVACHVSQRSGNFAAVAGVCIRSRSRGGETKPPPPRPKAIRRSI